MLTCVFGVQAGGGQQPAPGSGRPVHAGSDLRGRQGRHRGTALCADRTGRRDGHARRYVCVCVCSASSSSRRSARDEGSVFSNSHGQVNEGKTFRRASQTDSIFCSGCHGDVLVRLVSTPRYIFTSLKLFILVSPKQAGKNT